MADVADGSDNDPGPDADPAIKALWNTDERPQLVTSDADAAYFAINLLVRFGRKLRGRSRAVDQDPNEAN